VTEPQGPKKGASPRRDQEARNLLDIGRSTTPVPDVTQLTPGLTPAEVALLRDPARTFDRYVILQELGRGGMGIVHRAWDARLRRVVALKMAAQSDEDASTRTAGPCARETAGLVRVDSALMDRLEREAQAASRLLHPNLIRILDAGVCNGIFFYTMDLLKGISLADVPLPMPEKDALRIVARVARGVAHAHAQGVLHRDVKPSNILLSERGEPVLIDFGLAKDLAAPSATVTGEVFGTPCYMAPEQAKGDPRLVGAKADVYGLGATLYHLLAGKPPYGGLEAAQVLLALLSHPPYPPSTLNPLLSPRADAIVRKAIARDPVDRYESADALAGEIEALLGERPNVDRAGRTVIVGQRAWLPWAWVIGVSAMFCLGVGIAIWKSDLRHADVAVVPMAPAMTGANGPSAPPAHPQATAPASPGHPPHEAPPGGTRFETHVATPAQPDPTTDPPKPTPAPVVPPKPETGPGVEPATTDPDAELPAEARESLRAANEALSKALAMPLAERPAEWRARLAEALALAEDASAKAPSWPKPGRLRGDVFLTLGRYAEAVNAYAEYVSAVAPAADTGPPAKVLPAEGFLAEFLDWFRGARPWAEEVTPTATAAGLALAKRLAAAAGADDLEVSPFLSWRPAAASAADPTRRVYLVDLGSVCLLRDEFTEATARLDEAVAKKTHADAPTDRLIAFAQYEIACADARQAAEAVPRPKKAERSKLADDAVKRMQRCLAAMDKLAREKDVTATQAPRTYYEWTANNVRHWLKVDPWFDGLRAQPSAWSRVESMAR